MRHNYKTDNPTAPFIGKNGEEFNRTNQYSWGDDFSETIENVYLSQPEFSALNRLCQRNDLNLRSILWDVNDFVEMEWTYDHLPLGYSMTKRFIKNQIKWRNN